MKPLLDLKAPPSNGLHLPTFDELEEEYWRRLGGTPSRAFGQVGFGGCIFERMATRNPDGVGWIVRYSRSDFCVEELVMPGERRRPVRAPPDERVLRMKRLLPKP